MIFDITNVNSFVFRKVFLLTMKCNCCGEEDCLWDKYEDKIIDEVESSTSCESTMFYGKIDDSFRAMRNKVILFFRIFYEEDKKKQPVVVPECVVEGAKAHYPLDENEYWM